MQNEECQIQSGRGGDAPAVGLIARTIPGGAGYVLTRTIGGEGSARFRTALRGIALASDGTLFAAGDRKVIWFDPDGGVRRGWEIEGPAWSVAPRGDGCLLVGRPGAIDLLDTQTDRIETWGADERIGIPTAIGLFEGEVLVGDFAGRCIRRFDAAGRFLNDIGTRPPAIGFRVCTGYLDFAIDPAGVVHVADPGRHRVARYSREGEFLGSFGRFDGVDPAGFPGCCNPTNLALTPTGGVVVTEKAGPRVKLYDAAGALRAIIAAEEFDTGCKNMDVAVDAHGHVYVVDTVECVIHVFEPRDELAEPAL